MCHMGVTPQLIKPLAHLLGCSHPLSVVLMISGSALAQPRGVQFRDVLIDGSGDLFSAHIELGKSVSESQQRIQIDRVALAHSDESFEATSPNACAAVLSCSTMSATERISRSECSCKIAVTVLAPYCHSSNGGSNADAARPVQVDDKMEAGKFR
jgi:hypothetical protein